MSDSEKVIIIARVVNVHMTGYAHLPPPQSYELEPVVPREEPCEGETCCRGTPKSIQQTGKR